MVKMSSSEIARLAGVSRSTVSRVINGYDNVPDATREKVMKVIEESGYIPMLSGQLLAGKKTQTLGFIWVASGRIGDSMLCTSYFMHVTDCAAELGYLVLTCIVPNLTEAKNIDWVRRIFFQGRVDAGVFIGVDNNEPLIEELIERGYIVGLFDHMLYGHDESNRISVNFEVNTGEKAIDYLYGLGHRKIAIVDGNMNRFSFLNRHEGFLRGMSKHNLTIRNEWMCYTDGIVSYEPTLAMLERCSEYPTAICAANDDLAFGVYLALKKKGIRIPDEISVVGIDGHPNINQYSPHLTTFGFDFRALFFSLVKRTIDEVEGRHDSRKTEYIESALIERNSCKDLTMEAKKLATQLS